MIIFGSRVKHRRRPRKVVPLQRRRPLEGRFALPNEIWSFGLKQTDFAILTYLYYHMQKVGTYPTPEGIATRIHIGVKTVKTHLAELVKRGVVTSETAPAPVFSAQLGGHFFSLPNEVFTVLKLPPSALMVYALLLYLENRRTHKCYPSYRTIAAATGLAVNTVMKHVGTLADKDLIRVDGSSYYDKQGMKWTGNNLYTIRGMSVVLDDDKRKWLRNLELEEEQRRLMLHRRRYSAEAVREDEDATVHESLPL